MLAPIDAVASVPLDGGEAITLRLNMRTLALAKEAGVNLLKVGSLGDLDPLDLAKMVRAFAVPDQPEFTEDLAFALLVRHADAAQAALTDLTAQFAAAAQPAGGAKGPTKRARRPRS